MSRRQVPGTEPCPSGLFPFEAVPTASPSTDQALVAVDCGAPHPDHPSCAIWLPALEDMFGHGETDLRSEVGGVLLGELAGDAGRECTRVEDIVPALLAEASTTHLTFTHATWNQIHTDIGNRQDSLRIVGWYHTHPGFGPFYSAHDTFIHSRFFVDQRHVGVVLDPVRRSLSVFGWVRNEVHRLSGCKVYATARDADELGCFSGSVVYVAD